MFILFKTNFWLNKNSENMLWDLYIIKIIKCEFCMNTFLTLGVDGDLLLRASSYKICDFEIYVLQDGTAWNKADLNNDFW